MSLLIFVNFDNRLAVGVYVSAIHSFGIERNRHIAELIHRHHAAVAAYIASGMADVGFGVETAARRFGLDFIPLIRERYFFALPALSLNEPLIQEAITILQSPEFHAIVNALPGYDGTDTGKIQTLSEAFG